MTPLSTATAPAPGVPGAAARRAQARLLVVDDLGEIRLCVRDMLDEAGFHVVDEAASGHDALRLLEGARYDLIITDWHMPDLDGLGLLRALRAQPGRPPVVVMSGCRALRDALPAGADALLAKPFTFEQLVVVVERLLPAGLH